MKLTETTVAGQLWLPARLVWSGYRGLRRRKAPFISLLVLVGMVFMGIFGPMLAPYDPASGDLDDQLLPPFWMEGTLPGHWLGTDFQGRDMLSRIVSGAQITLWSAVVGLVFALIIGVTLGLVSGWYGGWIDAILMRFVDFMLALPGLLLALVLVAGLGASVRTIIIVVVVSGWIGNARYVRGEVLAQNGREYVMAAMAVGCGAKRVMFRHLFPNVLATVMVIATLQTGGIILLVAGLSFLGLGIPKPTSAWGVLIADGRSWLLQAWWVAVFPGVAISLLIISLNLVGDWMRDTFDPGLRGA